MIKRTLFFGNPAYLSTRNQQLIISFPDQERETKSIPIEDIGIIVLEDPQITITNVLLQKLTQNNVAVVNCDEKHMPTGLLLPIDKHSETAERIRLQTEASLPLKKNLWQQTVKAKIRNQAAHLEHYQIPADNMWHWAQKVTSGDVKNHESRAAAYYWKHIFNKPDFKRFREGMAPNNLLNYGYAVLRAVTARALTGSGLLPVLGIHHRNKYNAYCLADDIMEPYRPFVDVIVKSIVNTTEPIDSLNTELKARLLRIPATDVYLDGSKSPLMIAMSRTTHSLYECFAGISRKILYPEL